MARSNNGEAQDEEKYLGCSIREKSSVVAPVNCLEVLLIG